MNQLHINLQQFLPAIENLQQVNNLTKENLLTKDFLIAEESALQMYYSPHNEYINLDAVIVIVGITPGWKQMKAAFAVVLKGIFAQLINEQMVKEAKIAASFSGDMRRNITNMLDQCKLPQVLHIKNTASLFEENRNLLHTTSIIKYPVFYYGKNYTGHTPKINRSTLLKHYAYHVFPQELQMINKPALVIPLGKAVEEMFDSLNNKGLLPNHCYVSGFPHPSGANGHRIKQFQIYQESITTTILKWGKNY